MEKAITLYDIPVSAQAYVLRQLLREHGRPVVHIVPQDKDMEAVAALARFLMPDVAVLTLPAWDTLPYDRISPSAAITATRMETLCRLASWPESPSPQPSPEGRGGYLLLTTLNAATQLLPPRALLAAAHFNIRAGKTLDREALTAFLAANGYSRVGKVMEAGEYAVRGSLMDIFPAGSEDAIRIDLFGDEIESIRRFDPLTQISDAAVEGLSLRPVSEVLLSPDTIARFRTRYLELFGAVTRDDPLYASISEGRTYAGMEHWLPLFYETLDPLAAYIPNALVSMDHRIAAMHADRDEAIADYYDARRRHLRKDSAPYHPIPPEALFVNSERFGRVWKEHPLFVLSPYAAGGDAVIPTAEGTSGSPLAAKDTGVAYANRYDNITTHPLRPASQLHIRAKTEDKHVRDVILEYLAGATIPVILAANSIGSADRIGKMLGISNGVVIPTAEGTSGSQPAATDPGVARANRDDNIKTNHDSRITILPLETGFSCGEFILLTEQDMFGERILRTQKKRRKSEAFMAEAASFIEGELIVHREHGIGRFEGLITVEVNNTRHDCLKLIYDGGDKLFLPVENIDLVSRYGTAEGEISLDKLGGVAWQRRKSALKKRLKMAAEALIKVAAARAANTAPVLVADAGTYDEFVARFPYTETEDQLQAIDEVRADLAAGIAMDRLVCGDVGFGKTEVALRAAFIAAASGMQVAVVSPTTLLTRQHFHTFSERFRDLLNPAVIPPASYDSVIPAAEGTPGSRYAAQDPGVAYANRDDSVNRNPQFSVRMLSRLVSAKQMGETKSLLAEGKVDIAIGTHALLANSIDFKNLGLLIVDEEQHFGVAQKEKLKQLKANIHVLTLSATPIPRTLQLSLSGVRELSLITTPPVDRLAVRTYVMPYDPVVLREAMMREYQRGGKIFYVTPRVKYMAELEAKIRELVPEIKIAVAHGQMGAMALDKIMNEFYDGKYDLLLSTTIIESGIDIPTANTIIIDRADMFGLSQLYQLRGRVGRSKTRAYAYLTLPHGRTPTRDAERRLQVMGQLDSLGAGFQLASHDMDIRGFGNLLGEEQSGHVKEVGVELYQAMLEEAIADMKRHSHARTVIPVAAGTPGSQQVAKDPGVAHANRDDNADWSPQINLGMSVLIPEDYIEDLSLRLSLYRRAGSLASQEELESFGAELVDRFGAMPLEVEHFLTTLSLKLTCKSAAITRLDVGPKGAVLAFRNNQFGNPAALLAHIAASKGRIKLRPDQTLFLAAETRNEIEHMGLAQRVVAEISQLLEGK